MKVKRWIAMACLVAVCIFTTAPRASSAVVVDTGSSDPATSSQWLLKSTQWLAAKFTLSRDTTLASVMGYMRTTVTDGGTFTIAIYADGGEVPDTENELHSAVATRPSGYLDRTWEGLTELEWPLAAGTYWVSFEIRSGNTLRAIMPVPAPRPLLDEAYAYKGRWSAYDDLNLCIRITDRSVPSPPLSALQLLLDD